MAVQDPTTNYEWNLPDNGGDSGAWGTMLREILGDDVTGIDAKLKAVSDLASGAMPKSGGGFSGEVEFLTTRHTLGAKGTVSGIQTFDMDVSNFFTATLSGNTTVAFSNIPTGDAVEWQLDLTISGSVSITWPAAVDWGSAGTPGSVNGNRYLHRFYTVDGGTTILARKEWESA